MDSEDLSIYSYEIDFWYYIFYFLKTVIKHDIEIIIMIICEEKMIDRSDIAVLVSSCDLYEDAWNPFFRLLQKNWSECPKHIYLNTETKHYNDEYFDITCLNSSSKIKWGARLIHALEQIDSDYILFFLEDFFLLDKVNNDLFLEALDLIKLDSVGVVKFIPHVWPESYYFSDISEHFSPTYRDFRARNAGMASLWKKNYYLKLLRAYEDPWKFEIFGAIRSRKYKEDIWFQNANSPCVFPYEVLIKYGYGITKRKWLKNNKELFEKNQIRVNFDRLGWYDDDNMTPTKIVGVKRTKKEKLQMPFTNSSLFLKIVNYEIKQKLYYIKHFRNYF